MFRKIFYSLMLVSLFGCSAFPWNNQTAPTEATYTAEEQAVYQVIIGSDKLAIIHAQTSADISPDNLDQTLESIHKNIPEIQQGILDHFADRNKQPSTLSTEMKIGINYKLITSEEMKEIFEDKKQDGWEKFYERYPDSSGVISISRVGFNPALDKALVYIGRQSHWLAGMGQYLYLEKENGTWVVKKEAMAWIS